MYLPTLDGFDFSFGLDKPLDPSIGYFSVRGVMQTFNANTSETQKVYEELNYTACSDQYFNHEDQSIVKLFGID